ncbi:MAG: hypothetical protein C0593_02720 [Marinilabiliales bacterium]|nr:MAG: hypothetical protein C0593_02720 [Marinilabiliales bacterium]
MKRLISLSVILISIVLFIGCGRGDSASDRKTSETNNAFISAYSGGMLSSGSAIRVVFANDISDEIRNNESPQRIFSFSPRIKGSEVWMNERTLEFLPESPLKNGSEYEASIDLAKVFGTGNDNNLFQWKFRVIDQAMSVSLVQVVVEEKAPEFVSVILEVQTADFAENEFVEKSLDDLPGNAEPVWDHSADGKKHTLRLSGIKREPEDVEHKIKWDGKVLNADGSGEIEVIIPGTNMFKVLEVRTFPAPDKYIQITFSDIPDPEMNLDGLIYLSSGAALNTVRQENTIKAYPEGNAGFEDVLTIDASLQSYNGIKLNEDYVQDIRFEALKPEIRWIGDGVILPDGDNLIVPFEAVNLSAVDVKVVRVYESNLTQFFQDNSYTTRYNLKKTGRLILKEKVELTGNTPVNRSIWNTFSIDLSKLMQPEPGAMYCVELDFNINYSTYPCAESEASAEQSEAYGNLKDDPEYREYDDPSYNNYDYGYYYSGWWQHRDDPCFKAYYNNKSIERNILASNVGVITKKDANGLLSVFVNDILSSKPLPGAKVSVLNYQKQLISAGETDYTGSTEISCDQTPFLVLAESRDQKGYLKLIDGQALSLSRFDVSGQASEKGLKGFIYGERGVWRPGDTLYLSFMLNDKANPVPEDHPVLMELYDPQGRSAWRQVQKLGQGKLNTFIIPTKEEDITGAWNAKVTVGGAVFTKSIRIETIKPNRLRIQMDIPDTLNATSEMNIPLKVEYLHGAKAPNLKFETEIRLQSVNPEFKNYKDFLFYDPAIYFNEHRYDDIYEKLDANGTATLIIPDLNNRAPGFVKAQFSSRAYEKNGEFSVDYSSALMSPFDTYVGVKVPGDSDYWNRLETDVSHPVEIVTVDAHGKPVAENNVEISFYKMKWNWWYENSGSYASFVNNRNVKPVMHKTISTKDEIYKTSFKIDYDDWGLYLIYVKIPGGHATGKVVYVDWPGWNTRKTEGDKDGASLLSVKTDKEKYLVGEDAVLSFPGAENATAIITIENGSRILQKQVITTTAGDNQYSFEVTEEMTTNVYASIHMLQPHNHPGNDLPIRLYGVVPVFAEDPKTKLTPEIKVKDQLRSKEQTDITISEKSGREMYYTLAVVDEGLLGLTNFRTPSPYNHFFAREALGVKTWDMYDEIIGAFTGNMAAVFAIGGDESLAGDEDGKKKRFKPVVKFYGPFKLKKGQKQSHQLQLPEYVGAVRVMVVAAADNAYGSAEKEVIVKDPLMVHATMPRLLSPEESVNVPVTVFAMDDKIKDVEVTLTATGDVTPKQSAKRLTFDEQGEKIAYFAIETGNATGNIGFDIKALSSGESASEHIDIYLRNPNPYETMVETYLVKAGDNKDIPVKVIGDHAGAALNVEVASIPPINVSRTAEYMMRYPHHCAEQTTSAALVQMLLPSLLETSDPRFDNAQENVTEILAGLRRYQKGNGGIGMWPVSRDASPWVTCYVGHLLAVAGETGYAVPKALKTQLLRYLSKNDFSDQNDAFLAESYRLYVLALHGKTDFSSMNRLKGKTLSQVSKLRLAAAYAIAGKMDIAGNMLESVNLQEYYDYNYHRWNYYYFNKNTAMAMALETAVLVDNEELIQDIALELSEVLSGKSYLSTHSAAWGMYAMWRLYGNEKKSGVTSYEYTIGNHDFSLNTSGAVSQSSIPFEVFGDSIIQFTNKCEKQLFVNTISSGQPDPGDEISDSRNLNLEVVYEDADGVSISPDLIQQGEDFMLKVKVSNPGLKDDYKNMALTVGLPGAWEFLGLMSEALGAQDSNVEYIDIRDDKVNVYFHLGKSKAIEIPLRVHASYTGKYYMPAVICEEMYDNTIYALTKGRWVEVTP